MDVAMQQAMDVFQGMFQGMQNNVQQMLQQQQEQMQQVVEQANQLNAAAAQAVAAAQAAAGDAQGAAQQAAAQAVAAPPPPPPPVAAAQPGAQAVVMLTNYPGGLPRNQYMRILEHFPKYDGDRRTLKLWLHVIEAHRELALFTEDEMATLYIHFLEGDALSFVFTLSNDVRANWHALLMAIENRFLPEGVAQTYRTKLKSITQGGSDVRNYTRRIEDCLLYITDMSEADQVEAFKDGLNARYAWEVAKLDNPTLQEAITLSLKLEAASKSLKTTSSTTSGRHNSAGSSSQRSYYRNGNNARSSSTAMELGAIGEDDDFHEDQEHLNAVFSNGSKNGRSPSGSKGKNNSSNKECHVCNKTGHFWRHCPVTMKVEELQKQDRSRRQKQQHLNALLVETSAPLEYSESEEEEH